jgi:hypothetical protein
MGIPSGGRGRRAGEDESQLALLDPHKQTARDFQVFMLQHILKGFTVNLAMDGNESHSHSFRAPTAANRITTPLAFNYDERISVSISGMVEACDLYSISTLYNMARPHQSKNRDQDRLTSCSYSNDWLNMLRRVASSPSTPSSQATTYLSLWISTRSHSSATRPLELMLN